MNKKIDIPVELYARLQELSHLARYEYTEQEGSTWTIQNPEGESLLDARRKISPEAAELLFHHHAASCLRIYCPKRGAGDCLSQRTQACGGQTHD